MCERAVEENPRTLNLLLISIGPKRCVKELLKESLLHWNLYLFLASIRLNRCVKELPRNIHTHCLMLLTGISEKAVEGERYSLRLVPDEHKTQEICDRAVEREPYVLESISD